jgi:hypothetical protein
VIAIIYLTGATNDEDEPRLIAAGVGLVITRFTNGYMRRVPRYPWHGADIGMGFSDADIYLDWLDTVPRDRCLYAVSPDCYPDAVESLRRGMEFAGIIREMGFPVALVAQDGAERLVWPWEAFDVLFVGGKRNEAHPRQEWKISREAEGLCQQARNHGKWVHMGRVNSRWKMERARAMGCNSADGTFLRFRRRKLAEDHATSRSERGAGELGRWLYGLECSQMLPGMSTFEHPSLPVHRDAISGSSWSGTPLRPSSSVLARFPLDDAYPSMYYGLMPTNSTVRIETTFHKCSICGANSKSIEAMDLHFAAQHEDDEMDTCIVQVAIPLWVAAAIKDKGMTPESWASQAITEVICETLDRP